MFNGKPLPWSDYWYSVQLEDGRIHTGHFSLIRR
ncbi:T9SS type B sorting domain-containing protein [Lutimonas vermicola]